MMSKSTVLAKSMRMLSGFTKSMRMLSGFTKRTSYFYYYFW